MSINSKAFKYRYPTRNKLLSIMYKQGKSGIKNEINCQIHVRKDVAICFILNKVLLYEC
jgi:hypothetical protein